ncbi:VanZ family protein [Cohnella nanjingensis]|uniref:VanZ family protein n=1 Tax=Cohnella nanjingensis TaxID=1387779 RepID=A0A7X0VFM4_9BACL|nr:VanZ family protein [Cohnella nanjingensis]MBB6671453.1 VanZ family protein [Cohnella nanjingensis]
MFDKKRWGRRVSLVLLCCVVVAIFKLSSQPYSVQTIQPLLSKTLSFEKAERMLPGVDIRYDGKEYRRDVNPYGMIEFLFRKGAHLFVYGVLAAVTALVLRLFRLRPAAAVALSLLAVAFVAMLDEWNQRYTPARTPTYQDVLVDLAGGALSLALCFGISALYRRFASARRRDTAESGRR